ncbi:leucine-rich repeat domain-containing protein [Paenibacillus xylanexedens]|uniref:leucine-rich repeat domain-containing protein n=1 Tax=Paenibacillus xylanexedens TaxID=528191 RepID=UPI0011A51345|nr:leucine-rich repeat domain-containing protein [Paenibacillus xylanexedens]
MSEVWAASMSGVPWTMDKMDDAVRHLRNRATVSYVVGVDKLDDLMGLDQHVFAKRPDLILYVSNVEKNSPCPEEVVAQLAEMKHVTALKIHLQQRQHLTQLSALERMNYLEIHSPKAQSLDFIRNFKYLKYLLLSGKFNDLSPIEDCIRLETLVLNCAIEKLDFVVDLPFLAYLAIDSCIFNDSLDVLSTSNISMLRLSAVRNLSNIDTLETLKNLVYLRLSLPKVERLCDFSRLSNLRQLELDYMKSLQDIDHLWNANQLEVLELKEINPKLKAESFDRMAEMDRLRQVDFRYMDVNKRRIDALRKHMVEAGKAELLYENIPEENRIQSMALAHLSRILM